MEHKYDIPRTKIVISSEAKRAVEKVFESGIFIKGPESKALGDEFAAFCEAKASIPVSSGSTAIYIVLKLLNIGVGDEVITVPNTFIATVNAILMTGAKPVFADIDNLTFNLDPISLKKVITKKTKAIIAVHLYGLMASMDQLKEIAQDYDIILIEDAAQAHGASWKGKRAGSWGDFATFSFYPSKVLNTAGDGGIVVTNHSEMIEPLKRFINHGRKSQYEYTSFGFNFRLSEIQSAVVRVHLKNILEQLQIRKQIADYYTKELEDISQIDPPFVPQEAEHSYYLYTTKAQKRDSLMKYLNSIGIGVSVEYPVLLHQLEYIKSKLDNPKLILKNSENCLNLILALPMFSQISHHQQDIVINEITNYYEN